MKIYGSQNINLLTPPSNRPPNAPTIPSGPTSGYTGVSYTYNTSTTDPDGDSVRHQFDWGDGTMTTTDWYPSGTQVSASHSWSSPGTYYVRVRVQDSLNAWGNWSYPRIVNIEPRPTYSLTVLAYNQYGYSGYVPLYIDGQYVGTTGYTYTVTAGTHTIYVESPLYDYNNPTTLTVNTDKTVIAYYYSYYYG
ncbi:MAG: PKD domain-containing protein [Candidatus Bathyarchaeales archaeon]